MTIYYKATRLDGRDFYTGSVDYASALTSGEPLPELPGDVQFPGPGWYHLATVPTECVGMTWPCRLFEVEPVGDVFMDTAHPYKIGARSVRVLREIEAHRVFGPQGEQAVALIALIGRCWTLSAVEVDRLDAARVTPDAAWANQDAVWTAALGGARCAALEATGDAIWAATTARRAVRDAAWDAAVALLCRDLIGQTPGWDQDAYDALTGPLRTAIGPVHPDDGRQR